MLALARLKRQYGGPMAWSTRRRSNRPFQLCIPVFRSFSVHSEEDYENNHNDTATGRRKRYKKADKASDVSLQHEGYVAKELDDIDTLYLHRPLDPSKEVRLIKGFEEDMEGRPEKDNNEDEYLENGDPDPRYKIGKALLSLGRVHYRHADTLPAWFLERQGEICQYRSSPQIRRCLASWMVKHDRDLLEKYREKTLQWGHKASLKDNSSQLKLYGREETIAYANFFMPSRFGILTRVFRELKQIAPEFVPRRTLDFGCGPATVGAVLSDLWDGEPGPEKYTGVDISQSMIDAATIMTRDRIKDCTFYTSNSEVIKRAAATGERFDLVVASYALSDLPNDPSRRIATQMMFELLDVGGYLVIVEPGNPIGSHTTRTARQFILDTFNNLEKNGRSSHSAPKSTFYSPILDARKDKIKNKAVSVLGNSRGKGSSLWENGEGAESNDDGLDPESKRKKEAREKREYIESTQYQQVDMLLGLPKNCLLGYDQIGANVIAPCTHDRVCPMGPGTWCSFSQKVYSGIAHVSSEEKFSYVVIQKRPKPGVKPPSPRIKTTSTKGGSEPIRNFGNWLEPAPGIHAAARPSQYSPLDLKLNLDQERPHPSPLTVLERFMDATPKQIPRLVDELIDEVDWEEYQPALHREEWGRIVRSPIKNTGHVVMDLCTPEGRILRSTVARSNMPQIPSLYTALRKTTWGGLFPVLGGTSKSAVTKVNKGSAYRTTGKQSANFEQNSQDSDQEGRESDSEEGFEDGSDEEDTGLKSSSFNMFTEGPKGKRKQGGPSRDGEVASASEVRAFNNSAAYRRLMQATDLAHAHAQRVERLESDGGEDIETESGGRKGRKNVMADRLKKMKQKMEAKRQSQDFGGDT